MDYYQYLEIEQDASVSEIKKAYRIKALKLHPDKNLNDPLAKENFEKLAEVLKVLSEPKTRAEYDHKLKARKEKFVRDAELDSKRRKYKEDLEERERKYNEEKEQKASQNLERMRQIERVRKRNLEILEEDNEKQKKKIEKDLLEIVNKISPEDEPIYRMRVEWNSEMKNTQGSLFNIFSKFGSPKITELDKKGNSAYIEYSDRHPVVMAVKAKYENLLVRGVEVAIKLRSQQQPTKSSYGIKPGQKFEDFEQEVLDRMKRYQSYQNMARNPQRY